MNFLTHVGTYGCLWVDLVLEDDDCLCLWIRSQVAFRDSGCILIGAEHEQHVVRAISKKDVYAEFGRRRLTVGAVFHVKGGQADVFPVVR